ncbi:MAG: phytoene desaturase family protein [Promethearchaeota archaeon]
MNNTQTKHQTVVIIGAGFGGLSAAAFLADAGFKVIVLEKNESFGGRASLWKSKGFTFDMGPSWYLMPDAFERFFAAFNKTPSDYYKLLKLDPLYSIFFDKDDIIGISADLNANLKLFDELQVEGALKLQRYLKRAEHLYTVAMKEFLYRDYRSILSFLKPGIIKGGLRMGNFFSPLDKAVGKYFS